jgi:hypothetical protein
LIGIQLGEARFIFKKEEEGCSYAMVLVGFD